MPKGTAIKDAWINTQKEDLPNEEWRDCIGYDGYYQVSNMGRVKSLSRYLSDGRFLKGKIRKQSPDKSGLSVRLSVDGVGKTFSVVTLVSEAFLKEKGKGEVVTHLNKNLQDNRLANLRVTTKSESEKLNYFLGIKFVSPETINRIVGNRKEVLNKIRQDLNRTETHQICRVCLIEKPIASFSRGKCKRLNFICHSCRN